MSWRQYLPTSLPEHAGQDGSERVFQVAERLVRRLLLLFSDPPGAAESHPAWNPDLRRVIERAVRAIGRGDVAAMEAADTEIGRLNRALKAAERSSSAA